LETVPSFTAWDAGNLTLEPGVSYQVLVEAMDSNFNVLGVVETQNLPGSSNSTTVDAATVDTTFPGAPFVRITVTSVRDGWDSWQSPSHIVRGPFREPTELLAIYQDPTKPVNLVGSFVEV